MSLKTKLSKAEFEKLSDELKKEYIQDGEDYKLDADPMASGLERAKKLTSNVEKRLYLTSCWLEALCTAEARFLGWVYQEKYGKPFAQ